MDLCKIYDGFLTQKAEKRHFIARIGEISRIFAENRKARPLDKLHNGNGKNGSESDRAIQPNRYKLPIEKRRKKALRARSAQRRANPFAFFRTRSIERRRRAVSLARSERTAYPRERRFLRFPRTSFGGFPIFPLRARIYPYYYCYYFTIMKQKPYGIPAKAALLSCD